MIGERSILGGLALLCVVACSGNTVQRSGRDDSSSAGTAGTSNATSAGNPSGGTGGTPAPGGTGGTPAVASAGSPPVGTGGRLHNTPDSATNADECRYTGGGGANGYSCDYVSVDFSAPLPRANLELEVSISIGDLLVPSSNDAVSDLSEPTLFINESPDGSQALGFVIRGSGGQDYSLEWVDVVVRSGDTTAADSRVPLTYSCVAFTSDDWCWMAEPEMLEVTLEAATGEERK